MTTEPNLYYVKDSGDLQMTKGKQQQLGVCKKACNKLMARQNSLWSYEKKTKLSNCEKHYMSNHHA